VPVKLEAEIVLLLTPRSSASAGATGGKKVRRARPDPEADELLSAELAARDEFEGDNIELDGFVREHLLLELPLFPVKSDLPFEATPATDPPPEEEAEEKAVDPRLAPLAALAKQLQRTREE
ncbi:MAG: Large ribosomal subunit accumulation protein YceD, partial [Pseudomonadota bacterium]